MKSTKNLPLKSKKMDKEKTRTQTQEDLFSVLVTALEGGSNYCYNLETWKELRKKALEIAQEKRIDPDDIACGPDKVWLLVANGVPVPVFDVESDEEEPNHLGNLTMEGMIEAVKMYREKYGSFDPDMDAGEADAWFQLAVMKEIVFG